MMPDHNADQYLQPILADNYEMQKRRNFLKAASCLPISLYIPTALGKRVTDGALHVREEFVIDSPARVTELRSWMYDLDWQVISWGLLDYLARNADEPSQPNGWMLWAEDGSQRWILEFSDSDEPIPGASKEGFKAWLIDFAPRNPVEWLMVINLYTRHVFDDNPIDWRIPPVFIPTPHIDSILSETRGLLLWSTQAEGLLTPISNQPRKLWLSYLRREADALMLLKNVRLGGRPLLEIFDERTYTREYCFGRPDYPVGAFMAHHAESLLQCISKE